MQKAYGYSRVSSPGQIDGDGFTRQEQAIEAYAAKHRVKIIGHFREKGVSGTADETDRPAFQEMLGFLAKNQDFFDAFGGDIAIGIDRPILPFPNVKIVIEVVDQAGFRRGLDQLVADMRAEFEKSDRLTALEVAIYKEREIQSLVVDLTNGGLIQITPSCISNSNGLHWRCGF